MRCKFVLILFIVSILAFGCGIKPDAQLSVKNDFLGTWYSLESWFDSYDGVSDQYCGKYVFDENTVKFYTYGVTSSSSWTLRGTYPCTYSYSDHSYVWNGGSGEFHVTSCTFNGWTIEKATYSSSISIDWRSYSKNN